MVALSLLGGTGVDGDKGAVSFAVDAPSAKTNGEIPRLAGGTLNLSDCLARESQLVYVGQGLALCHGVSIH